MNDHTIPSLLQPIADTQSSTDHRRLAIQRVGIRDLRYPIQLQLAAAPNVPTQSVATWSLDVALPAEQKGTHMSRFINWLDTWQASPLDAHTWPTAMHDMLALLHAKTGQVEARFPFFIRKSAPVSGVSSLLDYQGTWRVYAQDDSTQVWAEVLVPVKSLCPCSKEISDYGAHNQRSHVTIAVELLGHIEWETLVRYAEESASSEIWGVLKRPDEKWITERAYDNPKFVEDLVRDVALKLNADERIGRYKVSVENFESIHNHSAFAIIER